YVGTFSKTMFPGLRLGYVVVPLALVEGFGAARASLPAPASALEQAALATFMDEGHFARHLRRMRGVYRERAEVLLEALRSRGGAAGAGGLGHGDAALRDAAQGRIRRGGARSRCAGGHRGRGALGLPGPPRRTRRPGVRVRGDPTARDPRRGGEPGTGARGRLS